MKRRKLLTAVGSATAVFVSCCLGSSGNGTDGNRDKHFELQEITFPTDGVLEHDLQLKSRTLRDPDQPLTIESAVTNTESTERIYGDGKAALGYSYQQDYFEFFRAETRTEYGFENGWWTVTEQSERVDGRSEIPIKAKETHERTLVLLVNDNESDPERVPDKITFEFIYQVGEEAYMPDGQVIEWGFSLVRTD